MIPSQVSIGLLSNLDTSIHILDLYVDIDPHTHDSGSYNPQTSSNKYPPPEAGVQLPYHARASYHPAQLQRRRAADSVRFV